ncbi:MAG: hypothetical protein R8P61_28930 [Bacteroidia bacterium]|nr:hypothetical protein [Bacteroidia bacterium]
MKLPCLFLLLFFFLFSCSPKEKEKRILGHHLDDFQACMDDPDESFDNIRDLSLGYSLSYPEYWEHETRSDSLFEEISAYRHIIDTLNFEILDSHSMAVSYYVDEIEDLDEFIEGFMGAFSTGRLPINKGKGIAFGKECYWILIEDDMGDYKNKVLTLIFPTKDKKHVIIYNYAAYSTDQWYNNICNMLGFKQDV